jgi:hypothetical protein
MDELDRFLADTMHGAATEAPSDAGLLTEVHRRSRRLRRRRLATGVSALAALVALGVPAVAGLVTGPGTTAPLGGVPTASAPPSGTPSEAPPGAPSGAPTGASSGPSAARRDHPPTADGVQLVPGYTPSAFPYTLPPTDGVKAPVASLDHGNLVAFFEATEAQHHADTTVTVSSRPPTFTTPATETPQPVRGHPGTLRTVDVAPARQLTLVWAESPTRWIQLATDDTYTPAQVVALAEALTPASIAVAPPFTLDLSPAGLVADTVSPSTMSFRAPDAATAGFSVVLHRHRTLTGPNQTVGGYRAKLTRTGRGVSLDVDVTDWNATLEVTVAGGLTLSDADVLRFAAGVHILNRSDPAP